MFFAYHGARVTSVDLSAVAINNLTRYCRDHEIENITPVQMSAQEIVGLDKVDFIFGSMILHHIEPFAEFADTLRHVVKPEGKGFFWENNAHSKLLMSMRKNIVGKLWVPKCGDNEEYPLMPGEVDELRKHFHVDIEIPELFYFRLISKYLLRGRCRRPFAALDNYCYRFPAVRKHSYRQYVCLSRAT